MSLLNRLTSLSSVRVCQAIGHQFRQQIANSVKYQQRPAPVHHLSPLTATHRRFYSTLQPELKTKLDKLVKQHKIVLFMKGEKDSPKCGFSNVITQILRMHGVDYDSVNVLENEEIRQGIKEYSQWPTIPQLFIDGEFIGGCDIVMQMHQNGELITLFNKSGIQSVLKDAAGADEDGRK